MALDAVLNELEECWVLINEGQSSERYRCLACPGNRNMQFASYVRHKDTDAHRTNVARWLSDRKAFAINYEDEQGLAKADLP
ncbi:hypothetical protein CROQUDRAFT_656850 [Cronartium quercuum f. sp. fusiforme G11]|uniref:Uncharacterized protein n=1 Tax=Cronartium quercuum f. sp. fusiforme G11 TaxID=708437 RepID=A0A9P6TCK6_9BASI|nr:hypothetical protein CROQUDRAFT_656850 [Cronartium quercuum f. sp. fusiforme G11]